MQTLLQIPLILAETIAVVALSDFSAGTIHWLEDAYFTEDTPIIGALLIRPNIVHHHFPRYFTRLSWWESSRELLFTGLAILGAAWWLHALNWQIILFVALSINANQIHKWSHRTRAENGRLISHLQAWHILQSPRHHGLHHADPKNTYYCPITDFVNPALEKISFWPRLEALIERTTGIRHRVDTAVRGQGPGPQWLTPYRPALRPPAVDAKTQATAQKPCPQDCSRCLARTHCRAGAERKRTLIKQR